MTGKIVCKFCIMQHGLRGSDLSDWPDADAPDADEWLMQHIERDHHIPVRREHETNEQAMARFAAEQPEAGGPDCKCPNCVRRRMQPHH